MRKNKTSTFAYFKTPIGLLNQYCIGYEEVAPPPPNTPRPATPRPATAATPAPVKPNLLANGEKSCMMM